MGKTGFFTQLGLLMWKNLKLYSRRPCTLVFEIGFPIFFACIMLIIRALVTRESVTTATLYRTVDLHPNSSIYPTDLEIGFVPNYPNAQNVMNDVISKFNSISGTIVTNMGFADEASLETYYRANVDQMRLAVVFKGFGNNATVPKDVSFTVRPATNDSQRWRTTRTYPFNQQNAPNDDLPDYIKSYTTYLMTLVGGAVLRQWSGTASPSLEMFAQRMPYPPYYKDGIIVVLQRNLPLFLVLSFILTVVQTTKSIVMEKEKKIKESMKLMGLKPAAHWASWFLTTFLYLAFSFAVYAILFGIKVNNKVGSVLGNTDISLFYVFLLCYALALISFCFMISVIVQKANVGAAVAGILFFGFYFPYLFLTDSYETMTLRNKMAISLLFNMALVFGAQVISFHEGTGEGAQWKTFTQPATVDDNFALGHAMLMLLIDSAIYLFITWYIDNVRPGEFGVPKPFYFCFTKSYWCRGSGNSGADYDMAKSDEEHFEPEPKHLKAGIRICNLSKKFSKEKVAVDNMRLNMYDGQITVLLGHNGAGKTTTMSMITGFTAPSGGTAFVNDFDIRTDIDGVRSSLGLCPQHNILWDTLTVEEHLLFFAKMKGLDSKIAKQEVEDMIKDVGLEGKKSTHAANLSGGQKRKLSVGIALIGGSKVVVLDEPSSGMDPAARRQTWELLQRHRKGRTILLTTHYMDEADVLGDRIAIMSQGVVKCCGSSLFLKKLFGAGYHLVVVKKESCNLKKLTNEVRSRIPNSRLEAEVNQELTYLLPDDQSHSFPNLFRYLEQHKVELGIVGFGTSATTLEEVFLKVGEEASDDIADVGSSPQHRPSSARAVRGERVNFAFTQDPEKVTVVVNENGTDRSEKPPKKQAANLMAFNRDYVKVSGLSLHWSHFHGMFVKKAIISWRHRVISIVQLLLPVIFTVLALLVNTSDILEESSLAFDLSPFGQTYVAYSNGSAATTNTEDAATNYASIFSGQILKKIDVTSTYSNMSQYLLTLASSLTTAGYNKKVIVGAQFDPPAGSGSLKTTAFYSGQPYHALPISITYALNALAKKYGGPSHSISILMNPLPKDQEAEAKDSSTESSTQGFLVGFSISFGMAFLVSSFVYFIVMEREVGAKHLQVVSGVGPGMFWLATLAWDYLNYMLPTLAMLIVFAAFQTEAYVADGRLGIILLMLMLYGWAALTFVYLVSFLFKSPASAFVILIIFNIVTGLVTTIVVFILELPVLGTDDIAAILEWVFAVLFPNFCMTKSFMDMTTNYATLETCNALNYKTTCPFQSGLCCKRYGKCFFSFCVDFEEDYMAWKSPGIGRFLVFMFLQGCVFMLVVLILDLRLIDKINGTFCDEKKTRSSDVTPVPLTHVNCVVVSSDVVSSDVGEDSDVARERERINNQTSRTDPLVLSSLHKQYGNFTAVDQVSVGVPKQECFGLLGQNGAGKTTTFKMLTGDVSVTSGNAYLQDHNIVTDIKKVQRNMGYCPQFDALLDTMTGRETLRMYARLRGVPTSHIENVIDNLIDIMMLQPHKDKQAGFYSGGNKRKLSTAIALVGDPQFLLLDEPSAGVDPAARRQLWTVLSQVRASGRTLVLTSHSMEECDALCTRIAIMVNGSFRCLGSPQHLKNKFGHGYTLIVKMGLIDGGLLAPKQPVIDRVTVTFPGTTIFDNMDNYIHFQVPDERAHVADVFELMEWTKKNLYVEDYSVHQTTLEQIFLSFTRKQVAPKEEAPRSGIETLCCCCCIKGGCYGKKNN